MYMKKRLCYLFLVLVLFVFVPDVYADDYKINELIPVDTVASVETDKFDYKNFTYVSAVDSNGNATIKFEGIQNNTLSKTAVSIDVLLFDEQQKNIGFLTYCTDKDVSSDNAGFKIRANQVVPFTISVTSRYFVKDKGPKDVRYIAVRDENRYCQIGGYTNFAGLTMEEINNGATSEESGPFSLPDISSLIDMKIITVLLIIMAVIIGVFGLLKLLKSLSKIKIPKGKAKKKKKTSKKKVVEETPPENTDSDADKPLDLNSLYTDKNDENLSISLPDNPKEDVASIEDIFTPPPQAPVKGNNKVDDNTNAISIESIYNSISELPEENKKEKDHSIDDLYNSINGSNDSSSDDKTKASIDDLYESINTDDDDDDLDE